MANGIDKVDTPTTDVQPTDTQTPQLDQNGVPTTGLTPLQGDTQTPEVTPTQDNQTPVTPTQIPQDTQAPVETTPVDNQVTTPEVKPQEITQNQVETTPNIPKEVKTPVNTQKEPASKVETAQSIKSNENINKAQENELNQKEKEQVVTQMQQMIQNGSTLEDIVSFGNKNNKFKDDINTVLRGSFKNASNAAYFGKYSTLNNQDMYAAYKQGLVVPGSEQYNQLPAAQRAKFDSFLSEKQAVDVINKTDYTQSNKVTDMNQLESAIPAMFSSSVRENYKKSLNNPLISELSNKLTEKKAEIDKMDIEMEDLVEDLNKSFSGDLPGSVRAKTNQAYKTAVKDKRLALAEYNAYLGQYQSLKSDAETELKISMYEDGIAKEQYQTQLSLYETRRQEALSRGQKIEDRDFTLKTQIQAEERQRAFTIEMKDLDQKLKEKNKTGTYQTDRDGNLLYLVNGQAKKVKDSGGKVVGVTKTKQYSDSVQKNTDGTYSVIRTYEDGRKPEMFNYGIDGNSSYNTQMGVYDALGEIDKTGGKWFNGKSGLLQCGEAANRYLKTVGITDIRVGDSYKSKKDIINNNVPQVGGLAIWNPNAEGKYGENGHIGMVTGYNPDKGEVEITDWNKNGDGAKNTYNIPVSQILNSDGGFAHLGGGKTEGITTGGFSDSNIPLYKEFLKKGQLTSGTLKTINDFEVFKKEALNYQKDLSAQGTPQIEKLINLATNLRDNAPSRSERILAGTTTGQALNSNLADYQANFDAFISNNALDQLVSLKQGGATFGALSDRELNFIQSSATNLRGNLSDTAFKNELNRIIKGLSVGLDKPIEQIKPSTINSLSDEFNSYNNSATGVSNTQEDYSSTLGF